MTFFVDWIYVKASLTEIETSFCFINSWYIKLHYDREKPTFTVIRTCSCNPRDNLHI